jgi:hypothetical protein
MPIVTVHVVWPDGLAGLPPDARARVTVEDVTRQDAASTVVGETVVGDLTPGEEPEVEVEVDAVDPASDLVVRVHVTPGGRRGRAVEGGDLVTTESYPVLTHGRGSDVTVRPRSV